MCRNLVEFSLDKTQIFTFQCARLFVHLERDGGWMYIQDIFITNIDQIIQALIDFKNARKSDTPELFSFVLRTDEAMIRNHIQTVCLLNHISLLLREYFVILIYTISCSNFPSTVATTEAGKQSSCFGKPINKENVNPATRTRGPHHCRSAPCHYLWVSSQTDVCKSL